MKIINVLKDDTFPELLELFRQAPEGEVVFVLPKNSKIFKKEDHFAVFAAEALNGSKTIAIMASDPGVVTLAHKFKFSVMASSVDGRGSKSKKKVKVAAKATVTAAPPPPADFDLDDPNEDAHETDVVVPSDETASNVPPTPMPRPAKGFHIVDSPEQPSEKELEAIPASAPAPEQKEATGLDYIEAMWRDKVKQNARNASVPSRPVLRQTLPRIRSVSRGMVVSVLAVAVASMGGAFFFVSGNATIEVAPLSKSIQLQFSATAADTFSSVDPQFFKLPGQLVEITKTASASHFASGTRDVASKARGTLTVTNEFSSAPQTLIATTRFVTADGKVFRTLQGVTVPGKGTAKVSVVADKPGAEYNVAAGKFIVAAFQEKGDTERAAKIYGTSDRAMSGGASGPSSVVTQSDYDNAKATAVSLVKEQIAAALPALGEGFVVPGGDQPVIQAPVSSAQPDDASSAISLAVTGTLKTVAFRRADLEALLRSYAMTKERLEVVPSTLDVQFSAVTYNTEAGSLTFTVVASGTGYEPIDVPALAKDLAGKSTAAVHDYIRSRPEIDAATIRLSPFWVRSVPSDLARIVIKLRHGETITGPSAGLDE